MTNEMFLVPLRYTVKEFVDNFPYDITIICY